MTNSQASIATKADIENWIKDWIVREVGLDRQTINTDENFVNFGMSSAQGAMFSGDISDWTELDLDPTLIWDYPNIDLLSAFIFDRLQSRA
ncbi:hypothetical protein EBR96_02720 [bacterium]|nr:hypothetical protein [bacterium]